MPDLWQNLKAASDSGRPILLYGMGNGADKILTVCEAYGIPVADFFASDGFVRGHSFHGKVVLSFTQACEKYGAENMIVLLSFASSRPEVLELIHRVDATCEMYIPDVPVCGTEVFNTEFYEAHLPEITAARALFADEESRRVYDDIIEYKLTGRMDILRATESDPANAYQGILRAERFTTTADLGAYNGDSIRDLRQYAPRLQTVIAFEPDRRNHRKLSEYATALRDAGDTLAIHAVQAGAWSHPTTLTFHGSGNRNAGLTDAPAEAHGHILPSTADNPYFGKTAEVPVTSLDAVYKEVLTGDTRLDYIKYDVEGAEAEALLGSRHIIERDAPALLVSAYHRSADLFRLPILVHELNPTYKLYLRRMAGVPAWDINLYAVKS
ncbi:MAG: FkbM family methyltransferase [Clostridia bacterium]|nr:FkbM family methyltransferase [Clostridia bacterium]